MTIKIEIIGDTLDSAMQDIVNMALGHLNAKAEKVAASAAGAAEEEPVRGYHLTESGQARLAELTAQEAPARERGQPSPGKSRRTKAEIAEDEAADAAEKKPLRYFHHPESSSVFDSYENHEGEGDGLVIEIDRDTFFKLKTQYANDSLASISTGDERVGPEDDAETVEQDAADEKAETEAARDPEKPLTLDDVRGALGAYVKKYGMESAQQDGPKVLKLVCGDACAKISDIPDDQAKIKGVVDGINEMTAKNPFQRTAA